MNTTRNDSAETNSNGNLLKNGVTTLVNSLKRWVDTPAETGGMVARLMRKVVRVVLIMFSELRNNDLALRSGALTYTVLLSLVPLLAMSTAVVKGLGGGDQLRDVAYGYIDSITPGHGSPKALDTEQNSLDSRLKTAPNDPGTGTEAPEKAAPEVVTPEMPGTDGADSTGMASHMRSAVDKLFDYVDNTNFATLGTFGVIGILLSVILVLGNIEMAMNSIWHVESSRSIIRKVSDYLTMLILMPISINVAFAASAFLKNPTLATKFEVLFPFQWLETVILKLIPIFFIALTLYIIYIFFPNTKVRSLPAAIGAVLAATLWFVVQNAYITLQVGVAKYNAIYGSFATLPLFLIWMYLGWLFILGGAQVAYACQYVNNYTLRRGTSSPAQKLGAAFDVMDEVTASYQSHQNLTVESLAGKLPIYRAHLIEEVVSNLQKAELLYLTAAQEQLLPAGNYNKQMIVNAILGIETADTSGGQSSRKIVQRAATLITNGPSQDVALSASGRRQEGDNST